MWCKKLYKSRLNVCSLYVCSSGGGFGCCSCGGGRLLRATPRTIARRAVTPPADASSTAAMPSAVVSGAAKVSSLRGALDDR